MEQKRRHKAVSSKNVRYYYLLALIPFLFLIVMYELLPLIMLVVDSLKSEQSKDILFTLENYQKIFSTLSYRKAIANSLKITSISTAFGIVIAFLGARAAYNSRGKFRNVYLTVLNMTSNFAGVPLAFAYMIILGNAGVVKQIADMYGIGFLQDFDLYSSTGLTMIYVYFQIPLSTLLLIPAFNGIRKEWGEANMLLGGTSARFWQKVGIPVLLPSLFSFVGDIKSKPKLGAALSVVMMIIMSIVILVNNYITKKTTKWEGR